MSHEKSFVEDKKVFPINLSNFENALSQITDKIKNSI